MTTDPCAVDYLVAQDAAHISASRAGDPERPDETSPRRDLLGELLAGRWSDDDPPTAPRERR